MAREAVLRAVHTVLERDEALRELLGHTQGATSFEGGARIIGDDVQLTDNLPRPILVLSFPVGMPPAKVYSRAVNADAFARDAFELCRILDAIERICRNYRYDRELPAHVLKLEALDDLTLESPDPIFRIVGARVPIRAEYAQED